MPGKTATLRRWLGHIGRMGEVRHSRRMLDCGLAEGRRAPECSERNWLWVVREDLKLRLRGRRWDVKRKGRSAWPDQLERVLVING